jgi:hypothetical protein
MTVAWPRWDWLWAIPSWPNHQPLVWPARSTIAHKAFSRQGFLSEDAGRSEAVQVGELIEGLGAERADHLHGHCQLVEVLQGVRYSAHEHTHIDQPL